MSSSFKKTLVIVATIISMVAVGSSFADEVEINKNSLQLQGDHSFILPDVGLSIGGGEQNANINGIATGDANGSGITLLEQGDSYDKTAIDPNSLTSHSGESIMGASLDLGVVGIGLGNIGTDQKQGSLTLTGNTGPSEMISLTGQKTRQGVEGFTLGKAEIGADLVSVQIDKYEQTAIGPDGYAKHSGSLIQGAETTVVAGEGFNGVSTKNAADQSGKTTTKYTAGCINKMSAEQTATSVASKEVVSLGDVTATLKVSQLQTHTYEQLSINPADGSYQLSAGSITTGTGN